MKSKISKILGVVLSLALLSSMAMIAVPVSAATGPGTNAWQEVVLPETMPGVEVRILELAPNGDLYAGVMTENDGMALMKSVDGGWNWTATALDDFYLDGDGMAEILSVAVSPDSQTVYVGTDDDYDAYNYARIWKIEDAGEGVPVPLQTIYGINEDEDLEYAEEVNDLEVWSDGQYNYVLAACDIDVLILRDALIETWVDLDLTGTYEDSGDFDDALVAKFSPDFDSSFLIWALIDLDDEFVLTACNVNSPGAWGALIKPAEFEAYGPMDDEPSDWVDFAFAEGFDSLTNPIIYAALSECDGWQENYLTTANQNGNLFLVEFAQAASMQDTEFMALLDDEGNGMSSVEVTGGVIAAGARWDNRVIISTDNAGSFDEATKNPTGRGRTQLILAPGFDAEDGTAYACAWFYNGNESAFSISEDGCDTFNQVGGLIDTTIDDINDMTFSPDFPSGSFMLLLTYSDDNDTLSLWRTENGADATPTWERVFCGEDRSGISNEGNFFISEDGEGDGYDNKLGWSQDGSTVMLFEADDDEIFKSTDAAQTFNFWRDMSNDPNDWVIIDGVNFYAACDNGFYSKSAYGPAMWAPLGDLNSIDLQPGFDADDTDNDTIVVGTRGGELIASADGGDNWGAPVDIGSDDVFVAFDQMDPTVVYYATSSSIVGSASISGNVITDNGDFEDSEEAVAEAESFSGLWVSPGTLDAGGNVIYALGNEDAEYDDDRDVYAWGRVNMDLFGMGVATGQPLEVSGGTADITGSIQDVSINDFLLVPTSGYFTDGEGLTVAGSLTAVAPTILSGTVTVTGADGIGTVDMVFTAADGVTGLTVGNTYAVVEDTAWVVDDGDWSPWAMVMGGEVTEVEDTFSDGDTPDVTAHTVVVDTTFPTVVGGTVAIQNPVIGKGTFEVTWDADFGFDNGDLGDSLDDFNDFNIEIVEVIVPSLVEGAGADLHRILIGEADNIWETAPKDGAYGLWGTKGSNIVWTVVDGCEVWALRDTMATSVKGLKVDNIMETSADISWTALVGAEMYEYKWDSSTDTTVSDETEATLSLLTDDTDYTVMVRVPAGYPFQSRWSSGVDFTTLQAIAMPGNQVPSNGMQNASTMPSFVWGAVSNAVSYQFQLSTDPAFGTTIVDVTIDAPVTAYTVTTALAFDTNHYWRVRAVSDTGTMSEWCFSNFHTMMEPIDPVTVEPPPTPTIILPTPTVNVPEVTLPDITVEPPAVTVNLPTPTVTTVNPVIEMPDTPTPVYIWAIVAIGALLTIAVIILIIRTRRVV